MSSRSLLPLVAAALLGSVFSAAAQPAQRPQPGASFPAGAGKEMVTGVCGGCHDINRLQAGYTPEGWRTVTRMMRNFGAPVPDSEWEAVTAYLIKSFPEKPRPAAVILPGPVEATIREFDLPTPGSRPHDPMAAHDGAIWWSGQLANNLGRLDPKTGQFKPATPPTEKARPYGMAVDSKNRVWFVEFGAPKIATIDNDMRITEYSCSIPPRGRAGSPSPPRTRSITPTSRAAISA